MRASRLRGERGSTTVLSAGILLLCGVLALVCVDLMRALEAKGRAQTAADAAALAAAQEIVLPRGSPPRHLAEEYAARNGATLVSCRCDPGAADAVVEVRVSFSLVFLGGTRSVTGRARAVIEGTPGTAAP